MRVSSYFFWIKNKKSNRPEEDIQKSSKNDQDKMGHVVNGVLYEFKKYDLLTMKYRLFTEQKTEQDARS
jgi:hypothetical protein